MEKTKILCVADGGVTVNMMERMRDLERYNAEITIVEDKDMYAMGSITDRMLLLEQQGPNAAPLCPALMENCADKDILVVHVASVNREILAAAPRLKIVAALRGGVENIDAAALAQKNIQLTHAPWRSANAVADFTVGMMIAENKNIARSHHFLYSGKWRKTYANQAYIRDMRRLKVGLVGFGQIGRRVADRLAGFGCKILVHDPFVDAAKFAEQNIEFTDLDALLAQADFVSVHLRLTETTRRFFGAEQFAKMKKTAYFINTARSGLADTAALTRALKNKEIGGAAVDVYDEEPLPKEHPYLSLDNITLTSHLAGTSCDTMRTSVEIGLEDLSRYLQGKPMENTYSS